MSTASFIPRRCPPFTSAAQRKRRCISRAARRIPSTLPGNRPVSTAASARFGVTSVASGSSFSHKTLTAAGSNRRRPLVATITGSTTNGMFRGRRKKSATTRTIAAECNMPVFAAAGGSSAKTASICFRTIAGAQGSTASTRFGFCAVTQVIALVP